ncbi:MAG TPA: exosortase-associated EpsI family protein [Phycisphaerae bacterium]|nr:exosortase-associated EpsI family protein [Phycisphaerae bacterium]
MSDARQLADSARQRHPVLSLPFLLCAILLAGTALGLRPGIMALAARMQKESIPLRKPLDRFDKSKLASFEWYQDPDSRKPDLKATGTEHVFFEKFMPTDPALGKDPVTLFVTYYSDPGDKVPHTPEVCYRQGPTTIERLSTITMETPELGPKNPQIEVRLLTLRQPAASGVILYLFYINGQPCHDREQVRWTIYKPGDRYVYFSKIEAVTAIPHDADPTPAIERCKRMLREALPVLISEHYPDDAQLR